MSFLYVAFLLIRVGYCTILLFTVVTICFFFLYLLRPTKKASCYTAIYLKLGIPILYKVYLCHVTQNIFSSNWKSYLLLLIHGMPLYKILVKIHNKCLKFLQIFFLTRQKAYSELFVLDKSYVCRQFWRSIPLSGKIIPIEFKIFVTID